MIKANANLVPRASGITKGLGTNPVANTHWTTFDPRGRAVRHAHRVSDVIVTSLSDYARRVFFNTGFETLAYSN